MSELEPQPLPDVSVDAYERLTSHFNENYDAQELTAQLQEELAYARAVLLSPDTQDQAKPMFNMLCGFPMADQQQAHVIKANMRDRLGDSIFLLARTVQHKGISLEVLIRNAAAMFDQDDPYSSPSFTSLDQAVNGRMAPSVHPSYVPDYDFMEQQGVEPFELSDDGYRIMADGYYALHFSLSCLSNLIYLNPLHYLEAATKSLVVVSAVAQSRLGSSLQEIVNRNALKLRCTMRTSQLPGTHPAGTTVPHAPLTTRETTTGKFISSVSPPSMN